MGYGRWDAGAWAGFTSTHTAGKSASAIFSKRSIKDAFDPKDIVMRESRDSADNPRSTPIIVAGDVTGSMGSIAEHMMREGLNTFATELYDRRPVSDPHLMVMGVGDPGREHYHDEAPLQVTQFEADIRIAEQLKDIFIEGGGLGNSTEGYHMPWWFAAERTSCDAFEKRGEKGILFTYGDELPPDGLSVWQAKKFLGADISNDISPTALLAMARRKWDVYHIVIAEGNFARSNGPEKVLQKWQGVVGQNAILLDKWNKLSEVMVSILQLRAGVSADTVTSSWDGSTSVVVANALRGMTSKNSRSTSGVVML